MPINNYIESTTSKQTQQGPKTEVALTTYKAKPATMSQWAYRAVQGEHKAEPFWANTNKSRTSQLSPLIFHHF